MDVSFCEGSLIKEERGKLLLACLKFLTELRVEYISDYWDKTPVLGK